MAWALQFDGVNDYTALTTPIVNPIPIGQSIVYTGRWVNTGTAFQMFIDIYAGSGNYILINASGQIVTKINNTQTSTDSIIDGANFKFEISRTSTEYVVLLNDVPQHTHVTTLDLDSLNGFSDANYRYKGELHTCSVGLTNYYDPTASSHTAGAPILTDTIGGNNATGVNMPTDGSAWVDLGGGGLTLAADNGAFATIFQPATLTYSSLTSYTITTDSGSFATTGQAVDLLFNRKLPVDSGDYSTTFNNASLLFNRALGAGSASYTTNFQDASLAYTTAGQYTLVGNNGAFNTSGTDLALLYDRALPVGDGAFNTTLSDANLSIGRRIQAISGDYVTTGQDISYLYNRVIMAQSGDFITTGYNVTLSYSGQPSQTIGTVTTGYKQDIYTAGYKPNSITVSFKE